MTVQPALVDRAGELRNEPGILDTLRATATTEVLIVRAGRARVEDDHLVFVSAAEIADAEWALIGRRADGAAVLLAVVTDAEDAVDTAPDETWLGLRDTGGRLNADDTETFLIALSLAAWIQDAPFCPRCGAPAELQDAGWSRQCTGCGRQHFPRTDPAVIVAIESADGESLLLGANANWDGRMYSCFAGFVEAGESLESTVRREIAEEAGVELAELRYLASQPWPFPRSLMLGFRAVVAPDSVARPDGAEIVDVRWFSRAEIGSALQGEGPVGLPGKVSIARALITDWYEGRA